MSAPRAVLAVVAGIVQRDGRVLLAQRPAGKELAGFWEFPGGKREPGEDDFAALRRELREELALELQQAEPLVSVLREQGARVLRLTALVVTRWRGEPVACEGQCLRWAKPEALPGMALAPADRDMLAALGGSRAGP